MTQKMQTLTSACALALVALTAGACGRSDASEEAPAPRPPAPSVASAAASALPASPAAAVTPQLATAVTPAGESAPAAGAAIVFTGARAQTEQFIRYYKTIALTPEQERIKVEALSTIAAPCCANNPLATCCCPCNMAKAAWGLAAFLITEHGHGAAEVRQAMVDWLAAANPEGFTGNACYTGGCGRPIDQNGCGGMNDRHVL